MRQRKVVESHEEAEAECSEHVIEAICAAFDRELGNSTNVVNTTLRDFLATASETRKAHWQQVRFHTATDSVWISRDTGETRRNSPQVPSASDAALPTVLLRIPRTRSGCDTCWPAYSFCSRKPRRLRPTNAASGTPAMRSSVSWQEKTLTLALDYERPVGLAHESVVGAGQ